MSANENMADAAYQRWGMTARPIITSKTELGLLANILISLVAMFGNNREAEKHWLQQYRRELDWTGYKAMLQGRYEELLKILHNERVP